MHKSNIPINEIVTSRKKISTKKNSLGNVAMSYCNMLHVICERGWSRGWDVSPLLTATIGSMGTGVRGGEKLREGQ